MKNVQRGTTGLIIMTEEYEQALANAGWHVDEFELFEQESLKHGDGITGNAVLDSKMDNTPPALWQAILDAADEIDAANAAHKE